MTRPSGRSAGLLVILTLTACASSGSTAAPTTTNAPPTIAARTTTTATIATTTTAPLVHHALPVVSDRTPTYAHDHHDYPAADIFGRCGDIAVSPVDGTVDAVNRVDRWTKATNDPATRGGLFVSIVGDDGVRYYLAHLESVGDRVEPGLVVAAGDPVGVVGETGNAAACHVHFGISFPCANDEWWVRRGVVWPWPYLDAWKTGFDVSPIDEVTAFARDHPAVCQDRAALPWNSR